MTNAWRARFNELVNGLPDTFDDLRAHWHARPEFHWAPGPIKLQAKLIPDEAFLAIVARVTTAPCRPSASAWAGEWAELLMPEKVVRAKARALIKRGLLGGCDGYHNCRGDWHLTDAGRDLITGVPS